MRQLAIARRLLSAKPTAVLIRELEAAGVHVPGISAQPSRFRGLRLVVLDESADEVDE